MVRLNEKDSFESIEVVDDCFSRAIILVVVVMITSCGRSILYHGAVARADGRADSAIVINLYD